MSLLQNTDFNSNLDWLLDPQPDMLPWFDEGGYSMSGNFSNIFGGSFPTFESHLQRITHSVPASPPGNTNLQPAMAPISGLPTPNPREDCGPDDPWPMAWHARKIHRLRLPPLEAPGGFMHKPFFSPHTYISTNILTEMQRLVNMCSVDTEDLELPDASKLNHCIDLYFINFSQVMSIVHRPTFDPRASIVVTLAMVAIGVLYSNFRSAKEYSYSLSELIRKILILMVGQPHSRADHSGPALLTGSQEEYDRRFVRTEDHLTAQILQGFHGYCSGNQRLFELSETSRGSLVTNARRMGLFAKETADDMVHTSTTADIGPAWVDWIRKERLRRIGWGVYLYDAAVSYLHNVRPYLTVAEVTMTLPSMELEWEAESAQSWAALHSRNGGTSHKISLRNLLRSLFDGTPQPLNKFGIASHRGLVVSTLVRMIWTIKELRGNPVHDLVGDASAQDRGDALLPALDMFLESPLANRDLRTQKEVTSLVRRLSLVHIGHLYAAGELMNWLYPLLRRKDSDGSLERRMRQWKTDRPQQVRDATFHAAQILGLARQFADYGPYQVFAVFHAGVVLFYMATLLSEPGETHHGATPDEPPFEHLQLDFLGLPGDEMTVRTARWVDGGHPVVIGLHGVPDLCSEHGRLQLLEKTADMLSQMELVWGVAENLRKVVLRLRDRI
ncbi:hypothetical protein N0V84_006651 [Fusarium piperis]|uniref:Xylanolytic transcriptional activator regulatory domain-containing protein n=1 Tax=Fusarium piperis TaxID=1435070 RepID=A0A9W8WBF0_9HYPO|nr:hypothetical protein N0V84_006651 [Fusarium piperis]